MTTNTPLADRHAAARPGTVVMISPFTAMMTRDDVQVYRKLDNGRWSVLRYPFDADSGVTITSEQLTELCRGVLLAYSRTREQARRMPGWARGLIDAAFDAVPDPGAPA
jgi:hypothetical protein